MSLEIVHRHHQTAELDLRPAVFLGAVPLLQLEQIVADVLPLALLDLDGDSGVGVVEVDAVIEPQMRPELAVRVVAAGSVTFGLVCERPSAIAASNSRTSVCFVKPSKTLAGTAWTADRTDISASSGNASEKVWARRSLSLVTSSTTTILPLDDQRSDKIRRAGRPDRLAAKINSREGPGGELMLEECILFTELTNTLQGFVRGVG